jgi:hypothetical protein
MTQSELREIRKRNREAYGGHIDDNGEIIGCNKGKCSGTQYCLEHNHGEFKCGNHTGDPTAVITGTYIKYSHNNATADGDERVK